MQKKAEGAIRAERQSKEYKRVLQYKRKFKIQNF